MPRQRLTRVLITLVAITLLILPLGDALSGFLNQPPAAHADSPGKDGDITVSTPDTILNQYGTLGADATAGDTTIIINNPGGPNGLDPASLTQGDLLMLYQAYGATIDTSDTAAYGDILNYNGAGLFEFITVDDVNGNIIDFASCGGLVNPYLVAGKTQIIRVPQYNNMTINAGASVTAPAWNGDYGGVVALSVAGVATINGTIDVDQLGFRGGVRDNLTLPSTNPQINVYRSPDPALGGEKGESIAGYRDDYDPAGRYGRGAPANGGGGGNTHNAGGGGGANGNNGVAWNGFGNPDLSDPTWATAWNLDGSLNATTTSSGGGRGGYTYSAFDEDALAVPPSDPLWGGNFRHEVGGLGGRPVDNDPSQRVFFGGGGGAGDGNNDASNDGGDGAGLVFLIADTVTGSGSIEANGEDALPTINQNIDAPGGGGGGGSVIVRANSLSGIGINATGGDGGDQLLPVPNTEAEGPGGGGGGGFVATSGGAVTIDVSGGVNGTTASLSVTEFPPNGATQGAGGQVTTVDEFPFCGAPLIEATKSDSILVDSDGDGLLDIGETLRYTIIITNSGDSTALNTTFTDTPDPNSSLVVGTVTTTQGTVTTGNNPGDTSVAVATGDILAGGTVTITFDVTLNDPVPVGLTVIANQGSIGGDNIPTEPTDDPDTDDDDDPTITPVDNGPEIEATKNSALLNDVDGDGAVDPGDTVRYTIVITNSGSEDATGVTFDDTPDPNTALVVGSVTTTQGTVTTGNTAGDSTVAVAIGTVTGNGGTVTITFDVVVNDPLPQGVTEIANQGTASGDNFPPEPTDDPETDDDDDPTIDPIDPEPAIEATKDSALLNDVDGDGLADPGDSIRYTVVISNTGMADATGVTFDDTPDPNTALIVGSVTTTVGTITSGNNPGDNVVGVDVGVLPVPGGSATIIYDVTVNDPLPPGVTQIVNQGVANGDGLPPELTDDPSDPDDDDPTDTPVDGPPVIEAFKADELVGDNDGNGVASPGDTIRYTIEVINTGAEDATGVTLTDTPDPNTTLVVGSVTTTQGTVTTGNTVGDTTVAVDIGVLATNDVATITYDVTINDPLPPGVTEIANQATISGDNFPPEPSDDPDEQPEDDPTILVVGDPDESPDPDPDDDPIILYFDPSISKVGVLQPGGVGLPGEQLTWIMTITNVGNATGTDIVVTDTIVSDLQVDGADTDRGTVSISGQTITFNIPFLDPGETIQARIYTTVISSPLAGLFPNTADLTGVGPNGEVVRRSASAEVPVATGLPDTGYPPVKQTTASPADGLPIWPLGPAVGFLLLGWMGLRYREFIKRRRAL